MFAGIVHLAQHRLRQTVPDQVRGLADTVRAQRVCAPALIVVGEVAAADAAFAWFGAADDRGQLPGDARKLDVAA